MLARPIRRVGRDARSLGSAWRLCSSSTPSSPAISSWGAVVLATGYTPVSIADGAPVFSGRVADLLTLAIVLSTRVASVAGGAVAGGRRLRDWRGCAGVHGVGGRGVQQRRAALGRHRGPADPAQRCPLARVPRAPSLRPSRRSAAAGVKRGDLQVQPVLGTAPSLPWLAWCIVWVVGVLALGIMLPGAATVGPAAGDLLAACQR